VDYDIRTDATYGPLEVIDAGALAAACTAPWWNRTLARVNDCAVRLGVFEGAFHWHQHDREDGSDSTRNLQALSCKVTKSKGDSRVKRSRHSDRKY
jgi:hypothetical protein